MSNPTLPPVPTSPDPPVTGNPTAAAGPVAGQPGQPGQPGKRRTRRVLPLSPPGVYQLTEEDIPDLDQLVIEDGQPVDSIFSEKQMRLLAGALHDSYRPPEGRPFVAMANVGLFHTVNQPPLVPDVMFALDVRQESDLTDKENLSYFVWLRGKVPDVAVEVVSNREGREDTDKLALYGRIAVPCYVVYDPLEYLGQGVLRVYERGRLGYRQMSLPYDFPEVGLGLRLWTGRFEDLEATWLRWCDAGGRLLPTGTERAEQERLRAEAEHGRAEQERLRAEAEHGRAEQERQRADEAVRQLEEVRAKLRALGIEPPA